MDLIIRVTGLCNFDCTFCSAGKLNIAHQTSVPSQIKEVIEAIKPTSIIISGGEPLLVGPDYYNELLSITNCNISITTNLKDFYYNPDRWVELFKNPRIGVTTSFNYGDTRRWDVDAPYTEEKFIEVYNLFKSKVGEDVQLPFIAVIDESNEDTIMDTVKLAKRLGTVCRINNATEQGRCEKTFPRYKMFKHYTEIIDAGLGEYEVNCRNTYRCGCPMNTHFLCAKGIRTCYVDKDNKLHYYDCCEAMVEHLLDYHDDIDTKITPVIPHNVVNSNCYTCPLFAICNGCQSQREHYPSEHCDEMLKIKDTLIRQEWVPEII